MFNQLRFFVIVLFNYIVAQASIVRPRDVMRKRKSRSTSITTVKQIISELGMMWTCAVCVSLLLATAATASSDTNHTSTLGTTQEYASAATEPSTLEAQYAFSNISDVVNGTVEGRSAKRLFIRSGNELWDGLVDDCLYKPSFSCFQKNVFVYLDKTLKLDDVNISDRILFKKIDVNASRIADELAAENEIPDGDEEEPRSGK